MTKALLALTLLFASAFQASAASIYIGVDDNTNADRDYQDFVVKVVGTGLTLGGNTGMFNNMVVPNSDNSPFWDQTSVDGSNMNIGNWLLGTGGFAGNGTSPNLTTSQLQYWANADGSADSLTLATGGNQAYLTIVLEMTTSNANFNSFGWYSTSTPNTLNQTFAGNQGPGATGTITTNDPNIGFYLMAGNVLYRSTPLNPGDTQQFAGFKEVESGQVPEPMTFVLMGAGLVGIAALRHRKP